MLLTRAQAHCKLRSAYPVHTIKIECDSWVQYYAGEHKEEVIDFSISVLPGIEGRECSCFSGKTLEEAVNKALKASPEPEADENEQYFSSVPSYAPFNGEGNCNEDEEIPF